MALSENPNLALIPSGYKSGKIYSVLPTSGVGDFDFSRSGPATRINSQGLIETVADGVPRLNYPLIDGKVVGCPSHLLEPQSTNLIQYSEAFDNAYWGKIGVSILGGFTDPKGGSNAYRVTATDKPNANVYLVAGSSINNAKSIFIKGVNGETTCVLNRFTDTKSLITLNGEWQRVDFVSENTTFFAVDMRGGTATEVQIFGAQNEILSYPTSYIPNYGTALGVTRSAETATNSGDASTFNDSEGVLMAEISALVEDNSVRYISLNDGSTSNRIRFGYTTPTNSFRLLVVSTGSAQVDLTEELNSITLFNKLAIKYKENDFAIWSNGFKIAVDTSGITPSNLSQLDFDNAAGGDNFYGNTKQIQYYDSADIDLEKLTSWVSFTDMAEGQLYTIE